MLWRKFLGSDYIDKQPRVLIFSTRAVRATDKPCLKNNSLSKSTNALVAFSLATVGAKKKLAKRGDFALCGGRGGLRALHRASL
jgi:hypothetical protein